MADPGEDLDPLSQENWQRRHPWDVYLEQRAPGMWYRPNEQAYFKKSDAILNKPFISDAFDPRPDLQPRIEDQRGLTLPELNLQAKFQKARGLGAWDQNAIPPLDPAAPHSAMAQALGSENVEHAAQEIAMRHAGDALSMHAPEHNWGRPDLPTGPPKKMIKKKEVK